MQVQCISSDSTFVNPRESGMLSLYYFITIIILAQYVPFLFVSGTLSPTIELFLGMLYFQSAEIHLKWVQIVNILTRQWPRADHVLFPWMIDDFCRYVGEIDFDIR